MKTAVITGASSGLGREYFKALAESCPEIEEFWLIARREEKLRQTAEQRPEKTAVIIPLDLADKTEMERFKNLLAEKKPEITMLVNNAGFGKLGEAASLSAEEQWDMVQLNCAAATAVSILCVPYIPRGGCIIHVSSIAAFSPNPRMTVYSSTKAYMLSFSRGLREELKRDGINVLAVCPGPMDTEFLAVANINGNSKMFKTLPRCDAARIASVSVAKAKKGRSVYTGKFIFKFYRVLAGILPHNVTIPLGKC